MIKYFFLIIFFVPFLVASMQQRVIEKIHYDPNIYFINDDIQDEPEEQQSCCCDLFIKYQINFVLGAFAHLVTDNSLPKGIAKKGE